MTKLRVAICAVAIAVGGLLGMATAEAAPTAGFTVANFPASCWTTTGQALTCYHSTTGQWAKMTRAGRITIQRAPATPRRPARVLRSGQNWTGRGFYCTMVYTSSNRRHSVYCVPPDIAIDDHRSLMITASGFGKTG